MISYDNDNLFVLNRGTKTLQEILSDRENISHSMQAQLDEGTDPWGVKVERVEM
jgi:erythrocyte band 7 integral membrane protein